MDIPRIVIISRDFRLAYRVQSALEGSRFKCVHLLPDALLRNEDIVIQSPKDLPVLHPNRLVIPSQYANKTYILSHIAQFTSLTSKQDLIVGVDPGKHIGVCIMFNGELLKSNTFVDVKHLYKWLFQQIKSLTYRNLLIRIGHGGDSYHEETVDFFFKEFSDRATIEIVDETHTSVRTSSDRSRHEDAAIQIASRFGTPIGQLTA